MARAFVFYNPLAGGGKCVEDVELLKLAMNDEVVLCDMTKSETYERQLFSMEKDDYLILCGGDGTLNRFINLTAELELKNEILYFPTGTGNDFALDLGHRYGDNPFEVTEYLKNLPTVTVKGKTCRFLNGVGYGIDGFCCQEGDRLRQIAGAKVNYTNIAIKGLLGKYTPTGATVTVDGVEHTYEKVWIAPTMYGRYYGGGMMPAPEQRRNTDTVSTMVFHDSGKLRTLMIFPSIFKGKHVKKHRYVDVFTGQQVTVTFDRPSPLQIDGETVLDVESYTVRR